ncbi:MAG TPA: DUF1854 domain-containing protein [Ottowia sp.]|uniref:cyanophycin metabolism-associated DUF1854 family protein n=1 Tax=Ottowia sp. TaxID=1898956 RepID=UPI002CDD211F|nr:DUF1854 domain-containing protein [Ottowia sp.]HMN22604.1 DUF1854 domain-containing protein [Ottowia sp.]
MSAAALATLRQDPFGRLVLTDPEGVDRVGIVAVRAFPIAAPDEAISLLDADGHELAWIERLADCPEPQRGLLERALEQREFMPRLTRLKSVSSFATPSTWQVETDRGDTEFVLKGEEQIRRLGPDLLIVNDASGVQYLIRDLASMDAVSRKLLDRFL